MMLGVPIQVLFVVLLSMAKDRLIEGYVNFPTTCRSIKGREQNHVRTIARGKGWLKHASSSTDEATSEVALKTEPQRTKGAKSKSIAKTKSATTTKSKSRAAPKSKTKVRGSKVESKSTKGSSSRKAKKKKAEKYYWSDDQDEVVLRFNDDEDNVGKKVASQLHMKIRGHPRPLRRHRTAYGRMYNPSEKFQVAFRDVVQSIVFTEHQPIPKPLFEQDAILVMTIIFRMRRPRNHFIGSKAGPGRMRETAPDATAPTRTDVDNMIKFVMDSMNQVLYEDDRQIMSLHVTKVLDDEGLCEGSTQILLRAIEKHHVQDLISQSVQK